MGRAPWRVTARRSTLVGFGVVETTDLTRVPSTSASVPGASPRTGRRSLPSLDDAFAPPSARAPTPARYSESRRPRDPRERSLRLPRWPSDRSSHASPTTPTVPRSRAMAAARSCRRRCGPTSSRRWPTGAAADRPTLVVAGDDRQARDLAADLRAWLEPRPVRFYPSRGVAYESHLAPPPHLVGLRVAALDALLAERAERRGAAGRRGQRGRAEREGARPGAAPALLHHPRRRPARPRRGRRSSSSPPATSASTRSTTAGSSRSAAASSTSTRPPRTARCAIDLFDIEIESLRCFSTFTQRSLGETEAIEIAPAAELAPEHRELAEIAALEDAEERPDVAELLPVDRFQRLPRPRAADAAVLIAAEEDVAPALADHWQDVVRRLPRRRRPPPLRQARRRSPRRSTRARSVRLSSISADQPHRVPRPGRRPRGALAARRPSPSSRSSCARATARSSRGRGAATASAPPTTSRACAPLARRRARRPGAAASPRATLRDGFIAAGLQPRGHPRAPALPPPPRRASGAADAPARRPALVRRPAHRRHRRPRGPRRRPLRGLRHEDRRAASRATTSSSSSRAPTGSSCRSTSSRRSPATSARAAATRRCPSSAARRGRR